LSQRILVEIGDEEIAELEQLLGRFNGLVARMRVRHEDAELAIDTGNELIEVCTNVRRVAAESSQQSMLARHIRQAKRESEEHRASLGRWADPQQDDRSRSNTSGEA
jgi:hypothetical protein